MDIRLCFDNVLDFRSCMEGSICRILLLCVLWTKCINETLQNFTNSTKYLKIKIPVYIFHISDFSIHVKVKMSRPFILDFAEKCLKILAVNEHLEFFKKEFDSFYSSTIMGWPFRMVGFYLVINFNPTPSLEKHPFCHSVQDVLPLFFFYRSTMNKNCLL